VARRGQEQEDRGDGARSVVVGLGRAFGGALLFALPMLMTMELWQLGHSMQRSRLLLLVALTLPLLVGVAHRIGFEPSFGWRADLRDAFIALGIGLLASAAVLGTFGVIRTGMPADEIVGKIAVQSVPAALGALLGRSQLGGERPEDGDTRALSGYFGALFLMLVGALFLSLNVAPTEEMVLIAYKMSAWHALVLLALSILLMHGFVFALEFHGTATARAASWLSPFVRLTLVGYVLALVISLYVLWTFGRTDGIGAGAVLSATIVLGFPAAIGAAAARLIL
jgi:putative integral membrane protein (TIGR02587 family)